MLNKNIFYGDTERYNYEKEWEANNAALLKGAELLGTHHFRKANLTINPKEVLSPIRSAELVTSATQDIIRYAVYHPIKKDNGGTLLISEAVRAAYLTKWIMIFKPLNLDQNLTEAEKVQQIGASSRESNTVGKDNRFTLQFLCNEYLALCVASSVIELMYEDKRVTLIDYLALTADNDEGRDNEINSLLYNLRYRIKHQDVYHLFYNRLLHGKFPSKTNAKASTN